MGRGAVGGACERAADPARLHPDPSRPRRTPRSGCRQGHVRVDPHGRAVPCAATMGPWPTNHRRPRPGCAPSLDGALRLAAGPRAAPQPRRPMARRCLLGRRRPAGHRPARRPWGAHRPALRRWHRRSRLPRRVGPPARPRRPYPRRGGAARPRLGHRPARAHRDRRGQRRRRPLVALARPPTRRRPRLVGGVVVARRPDSRPDGRGPSPQGRPARGCRQSLARPRNPARTARHPRLRPGPPPPGPPPPGLPPPDRPPPDRPPYPRPVRPRPRPRRPPLPTPSAQVGQGRSSRRPGSSPATARAAGCSPSC